MTKTAWVVAVVLVLGAKSAWACSCSPASREGFFLGGAQPRHLPADAKGVVFIALRTEKPVVTDFRVEDVTAKTEVKFAVRVLSIDDGSGWQLVRLEPVGGLVPKHAYVFATRKAEPSTASIEVDAQRVGAPDAAQVTLAAKPSAVRPLSVARGGSCSGKVEANVQELRFSLPPALEPYRESGLYFTRTAAPESWRPYRASLCQHPEWGRSGGPTGEDLFFVSCDSHSTLAWEAQGTWAFPELEDALHQTATVQGTLAACG